MVISNLSNSLRSSSDPGFCSPATACIPPVQSNEGTVALAALAKERPKTPTILQTSSFEFNDHPGIELKQLVEKIHLFSKITPSQYVKAHTIDSKTELSIASFSWIWAVEVSSIIKAVEELNAVLTDIAPKIHHYKQMLENNYPEFLKKNLLKVRAGLERVKQGIHTLQNSCNYYQLNVGQELFDTAFKTLDQHIFPQLPVEDAKIRIGTPKGWWESLCELWVDSNHSEDIDWKIDRYKSILRQLRIGVEIKLYSTLSYTIIEEIHKGTVQPHSNLYEIQELYQSLYSIDLEDMSITQEYLKSIRSVCKGFIPALRKLLESTDESKLYFANELSASVYTNNRIGDEACDLITKFEAWGRTLDTELDLALLNNTERKTSAALENTFNSLVKVPSCAAAPLSSQVGISLRKLFGWYDNLYQGNFPQCIGNLRIENPRGQKSVKLLAFGTPTKADWVNGVELLPEFLGFLRAYRKNKKAHLYVILLDSVQQGVTQRNEAPIIDLIKKTAEEFPDTLYGMVFTRNSQFYYQSGPYYAQDNAKEFKKELLCQHFDSHLNGNEIFANVTNKIPNFRSLAELICDHIHENLFESRTTLTITERQIFIEKFQLDFIKMSMILLGVDSFGPGCFDTADRSMDFIAKLLADLGVVNNYTSVERYWSGVEMILLYRALSVLKRNIIKKRFDSHNRFMKFVEDHNTQMPLLHKKMFPSYNIIPSIEGFNIDDNKKPT